MEMTRRNIELLSCLTEDERAQVLQDIEADSEWAMVGLEEFAAKHRSDLINFNQTSLCFLEAEEKFLPELKKMWPNKFFEFVHISAFLGGGVILTGPEDMKCEHLQSGRDEQWHGFLFHSDKDGKFLVMANQGNSQVVVKTIGE